MPAPLVPDDDLYARLEVSIDASPEAIELAWRALLKRHHPDVAGDDAAALDRAKRINVAHDWLADPELRGRYDRERLRDRGAGRLRGQTGVRHGRPPRGPARGPWPAGAGEAGAARGARGASGTRGAGTAGAGAGAGAGPAPRRVSRRPDLAPGTPGVRLARFLGDVSRLTADELDRLGVAEPPPIAFLATIRRFVPDEARAAFEDAESQLAARVPRSRWAEVGLREGLLAVLAELILSGFLDETLDEPFRSRARERLLRAWQASVEQPRYGPNGADVEALLARIATLTPSEVSAFLHASQGAAADDLPWPAALDRGEDEALRISAVLAARDAAAALPTAGLAPAVAARARRLAGRLGHLTALRHAFPGASYATLTAAWTSVTGAAASHASGPSGQGRRPGPRHAARVHRAG